jgi:hypothetical protein
MTNNKQQTEINAVEYLSKVNQFAEQNNTDKPKQQTAIEWLFDNVYMAHSELSEKLQQAKEMEKQQMIEFSEQVFRNRYNEVYQSLTKVATDTYNKTYGGGEQ